MILKNLFPAKAYFQRFYHSQEDWCYIEDPTYMRSIGSHVCMTCSKFAFTNKASNGNILSCNFHQKLIWQGQHLTHSCEKYHNKKGSVIEKKMNQLSQV